MHHIDEEARREGRDPEAGRYGADMVDYSERPKQQQASHHFNYWPYSSSYVFGSPRSQSQMMAMQQRGGDWNGNYARSASSSSASAPRCIPVVAANAGSSDDTAGMICGVLVCLLFLVLLGFTLSYPGTYYYQKYYYNGLGVAPGYGAMPPLHPYPYMP